MTKRKYVKPKRKWTEKEKELIEEDALYAERLLTPIMRRIAKTTHQSIPVNWGFGLFLFQMDGPGPFLFISNADKDSLYEAMREFLDAQVEPTDPVTLHEWNTETTKQ